MHRRAGHYPDDRASVRSAHGRLCYVRVGDSEPSRATRLVIDILGLEPVSGDTDQALFRSDDRHHTLAIVGHGLDAVGIEVRDLGVVADRLGSLGFVLRKATADECGQRHVREALFARDNSGNTIELVSRPSHAGRRFYPPVDAGVTGLRAAALRSRDIAGDVRFWTEGLGAEIADWVGDITYIRLEGEHHQIALYPSDRAGILYHSYGVADFDSVMRGYYALAEHQAEIIQGPGCETASGDIFLRARAAGGAIFSLVAPDTTAVSRHSPRQFERTATSLCSWGSRCEALPELSAAVAG